MARRRARSPKRANTYSDIEQHRRKGKQGEDLTDATVKGLTFHKQGTRVYARLRVTNKATGKRELHAWGSFLPSYEELMAEAHGGPLPLAPSVPGEGEEHSLAFSQWEAERLKLEHAAYERGEELLGHVRAWARKLQRQAKGLAPAPESEATKLLAKPGPLTVAQLADKWLAGPVMQLAPSTQRDYGSMMRRHVKPALGYKLAAEVKRADVAELFRNVGAKTPILANRLKAMLSSMYSWANDELELGVPNPASKITSNKENERERWFTEEELARLGEVLKRWSDNQGVQAIKLIALTGARKGEVLKAKWSEFAGLEGNRPTWTIPALRTKTGEKVVRYLDAATVALLKSIPRQEGSPYLFPSPRVQGKPRNDVWDIWQKVKQEAGIADGPGDEPAVIHTLRHTVASHIVSDGGELLTAARQLGHQNIKTTQRYAKLAPGKLRDTMTTFGRKLGA